MAAGLGFKTFAVGEILSAANVNGYLMQGVLVFADAAARDAAITSPQEGQFAYLKDTNVTTYYTGSAWANLDTTGMTNPMTTTGDIIYSSPGSTPVRLGIGTAGQVLKVNSGATAPEWGAASGGSTFVGCSLKSSTDQTISNNTLTAVTWDQEDFDTDAFHSTSSNTSRITIPAGKGGKYQVNAFAQWDANATGDREIHIYKNGVSVKKTELIPSASVFPSSTIMMIIDLVATDYIELFCFQLAGVNQVLYKSATSGHFSVGYLGA